MLMDKMKMKEMLFDELLDEMEEQEGSKLKPQAAMIAVGHAEPGDDGKAMPDSSEPDEDDEDLKQLLAHYMGK